MGAVSIMLGISIGANPFLLGALADASSTHTAFLIVPVLAILEAALLTRYRVSAPASTG